MCFVMVHLNTDDKYMNDHYYQKDVIDLKLDSVHTRFSAQDKVLAQILEQTTKTNGRVNNLENGVRTQGDEIKKWKNYITAGVVVASAMGAPGMFAIIKTLLGI